jgi:RNA polymerase sigma-70 factor (ECF subfamily)
VTHTEHRRYHFTDATDTVLVRLTIDGNAAAFVELVERHSPTCLRYAMRMLGSREDAEEATQEALLRAHRALARYDGQTAFRTWLMSILINRCRTTLLTRRRRTSRIVLDDDAVQRASAGDTSVHIDLRDTIDRAIARLDPAHREAFLLKHVEQLSYDEMSAITGVGISALKMRVQRACDQLRTLLAEDRHA